MTLSLNAVQCGRLRYSAFMPVSEYGSEVMSLRVWYDTKCICPMGSLSFLYTPSGAALLISHQDGKNASSCSWYRYRLA